MRMCHFQAQNDPFVLNKIFLAQNITITFIHLLAFFIVENLKKFLQQIQSYKDVPFLGPKWSICSKQIFFWKIINSDPPISPIQCAKFLKNYVSWVMRMCNFGAQNGLFPQMKTFSENLLMSLVSFIHAYLHAKNVRY